VQDIFPKAPSPLLLGSEQEQQSSTLTSIAVCSLFQWSKGTAVLCTAYVLLATSEVHQGPDP